MVKKYRICFILLCMAFATLISQGRLYLDWMLQFQPEPFTQIITISTQEVLRSYIRNYPQHQRSLFQLAPQEKGFPSP